MRLQLVHRLLEKDDIVLRQGVGFPATHHLFGQWLPPLECSKLMAYSYAGYHLNFRHLRC